jgi:hypothetical protein
LSLEHSALARFASNRHCHLAILPPPIFPPIASKRVEASRCHSGADSAWGNPLPGGLNVVGDTRQSVGLNGEYQAITATVVSTWPPRR